MGARWLPDGQHILFSGRDPNAPIQDAKDPHRESLRSYVIDVTGGSPRAVTPEGTWVLCISGNGSQAAAISREGISIWPLAGGAPRMLAASKPGDRPIAWSDDGRSLWAFRRDEVPMNIYRFDIPANQRQLWKQVAPPDTEGVYSVNEARVTPDGRGYFYSYKRVLSELYVATGLH
jgi:hypothetical protein